MRNCYCNFWGTTPAPFAIFSEETVKRMEKDLTEKKIAYLEKSRDALQESIDKLKDTISE